VSSHRFQPIRRILAAAIVAISVASPASSQASAPCARGACSNGGAGAESGQGKVDELAPILYTARSWLSLGSSSR
jgi:hypothetical protein